MKGESRTKGDLRNRTRQFALEIITNVYPRLPKTNCAQVIGDQPLRSVNRSGDFLPLNLQP